SNHLREPVGELPGGRKGWRCRFDLRDLKRICSGQMIPPHGQEPRNPAGRWQFHHRVWHSLPGPALACCPLSDDPKTAAETILPEAAPTLGASPAAAGPFVLQP